jgi:hypothetical protein
VKWIKRNKMCEGFGLIVSKESKLYFMEPDSSGNCSHSKLLARLDWIENNNQYLRNFVRVEFPDWKPESFHFDEVGTLPGWVENNRDEILSSCVRIFELCVTTYAEFRKVCAITYAEYEKVCDTTREEYKKMRDTAWAEMIADFSKIEGYVTRIEEPK